MGIGFDFTVPPAGSVGTPLSEYTGLYTQDGSTPQTVNIAPSKLTAFTTAATTKGDIVADPATDTIIIGNTGIYMGVAQFSFSGSISATLEMHMRVNGVERPEGFHRKLGTGGDVGSASFVVFPESLNANDEITVYVQSDGNGDSVTVVDAQFVLYRID